MMAWGLNDVEPLSTSGAVTMGVGNLIGCEIVAGRAVQGAARLDKSEIPDRFDAGRGGVGEALEMLAADSLVLTRPKQSTQVLPADGLELRRSRRAALAARQQAHQPHVEHRVRLNACV